MTDILRDRIAAVAVQHDPYDYAGGLKCRCGFREGCGGTAVTAWAEHLADAVIAALHLRVSSYYRVYHGRETVLSGWYVEETDQ